MGNSNIILTITYVDLLFLKHRIQSYPSGDTNTPRFLVFHTKQTLHRSLHRNAMGDFHVYLRPPHLTYNLIDEATSDFQHASDVSQF